MIATWVSISLLRHPWPLCWDEDHGPDNPTFRFTGAIIVLQPPHLQTQLHEATDNEVGWTKWRQRWRRLPEETY